MSQNKSRYAKGNKDLIVDIGSLSCENKKKYAPYFCCGCKKEMMANIGRKNKPYFSHWTKASVNCNSETYLHSTAKEIFAENYRKCLRENIPYFLFFREEKHDLTKYFNIISIEKGHGGFVADILLESKNNEVIFVEIEVTHSCEENKINTGFRIIELKISSEDDLESLRNNSVRSQDTNINTYNFITKKEQVSKKVSIEKNDEVKNIFIVYNSKNSIVLTISASKIEKLLKQKSIIYHSFVEGNSKPIHMSSIKKAYEKGIDVSSCYLCNYFTHGTNTRNPIYCEKKATLIQSTIESINCEYFNAEKKEECAESINEDKNKKIAQIKIPKLFYELDEQLKWYKFKESQQNFNAIIKALEPILKIKESLVFKDIITKKDERLLKEALKYKNIT